MGTIAAWMLGLGLAGGDVPPAPVLPLADGVAWLPGRYAPPRQPDGNSVLFAAPDGGIVFDSGRHPEHAAALLAAIGSGELTFVVNSHWHLDHVGGNPALRAAHPRLQVLSSSAIDGALSGFLARYADQLRAMLAQRPDDAQADAWRAELARIDGGKALRPDRAIAKGGPVTLAGREFLFGVEPHAVTEADVWLLDPASGVLAAGDLVTLPAPFLDTACPAGWQAALQRLSSTGFRVLVPGHGAPMDARGFATWRAAFDGLLACAGSDAAENVCIDGWLDAAAPLLPDAAARAQARDLLGYYVPQVLRGPDAAARCPAVDPKDATGT